MKYTIHDSATGEILSRVLVAADRAHAIEALSSESAEGHVISGDIPEVEAAVGSPTRRVYLMASAAGVRVTNLTPHAITVRGETGDLTIPPSGQVARVGVTRRDVRTVTVDGVAVRITRPVYGDVTGLPPAECGVILLVASMVREASPRTDLLSPGDLIRDDAGRPVACASLDCA